ncbi:MAG: GNAT family N-acetyltransferase [Acidimicrobiales bacterium]
MEIRTVRAAEHEGLAALTVEAYTSLPGDVIQPDYRAELADVAGRAAVATVLVAVDSAGALLGGVTLVPGPDNPLAEHTVDGASSMRMLAVAPDVQGQGIGEALVRACIARTAGAGATELVLHTAGWMHSAHRLYARLGFRRDPALDWTPAPGVDLLGFRLSL